MFRLLHALIVTTSLSLTTTACAGLSRTGADRSGECSARADANGSGGERDRVFSLTRLTSGLLCALNPSDWKDWRGNHLALSGAEPQSESAIALFSGWYEDSIRPA